jgi:transcriptional regulator NrdR family protein
MMKGNKRRRECKICGKRFNTIEITEEVKDKVKNLIELIEEITET